jgi:thioredoxin reductase (NADPH)
MVTTEGQVDIPTPRALETDEIPGIVEEFVQAARNAVAAGDVRGGSMKRVASASGEGASVVPLVHAWLAPDPG